MSFEFIKMLLAVTAVNFVVVFGGTIGVLFLRDKFFPRKEEGEADE